MAIEKTFACSQSVNKHEAGDSADNGEATASKPLYPLE